MMELVHAGLVTTKRRPVNESDFQADALCMRNVHFLQLERLAEPAAVTPRRRVVRVPEQRGTSADGSWRRQPEDLRGAVGGRKLREEDAGLFGRGPGS